MKVGIDIYFIPRLMNMFQLPRAQYEGFQFPSLVHGMEKKKFRPSLVCGMERIQARYEGFQFPPFGASSPHSASFLASSQTCIYQAWEANSFHIPKL